uniref:Uncharacterized protein n=1 Tax=Oryza brachyantha TaxID=4533 RepID=J3N5U5_ORYBR
MGYTNFHLQQLLYTKVILQISPHLVVCQHYKFQSGINHGFDGMNSRKNLYKYAGPRTLIALGRLESNEKSTTKDNNDDLAPNHGSLTTSKTSTLYVRTRTQQIPEKLPSNEELTTYDYPCPHPSHPCLAP